MKFFKCNICGNFVGVIKDGGGTLVCCGEPMEEVVAKTIDEGKEKHLPIVERKNNKLYVKIGEIPHPMTEAHYIEWVAIKYNNTVQRKKLKYTDKPELEFDISEDYNEVEINAYCNIHGLWKTIYKK